jgi:hypothetical protein
MYQYVQKSDAGNTKRYEKIIGSDCCGQKIKRYINDIDRVEFRGIKYKFTFLADFFQFLQI